jgi:uncharacterized membrane protein (DUF485 family)
MHMKEEEYNWAAILENKTFIKLQRKKTNFLVLLWLIGSLPYLLLICGAAYTPELFKVKLLGRANFGYLFCMLQFFTMIIISIYYNWKTGRDFDPLTRKLVEEIDNGRIK